jgi:drug/metabolite transporter (DMT)-like permease
MTSARSGDRSPRYSFSLLRIGLAGVVWGSIPLFVRMVPVSPFVIVFWRVVFGGAAALVYLLATRKIGSLRRLDRRGVLALVAVGVLLAANWVLFLGGLAMTRVAVAELLGYTGPVFVVALAPIMGREAFDRRIILPLVLALGGTAVILGLGGLSLGGGRSLLGAIMAFSSAITYSGLMLTGKRLIRSIEAPVIVFGEYVVASLLLLPAALVLTGPAGGKQWGALATLGVVQTTIATLIFFSGLRRVRADHAAVFMYAEPVTAVIFAAVFLAEPLGWATALGGAAVVAAGVLVARMAPPGAPPSGLEAPAGAEVAGEPEPAGSGSRGGAADAAAPRSVRRGS